MYQVEELHALINNRIKEIDFSIEPIELYSPIEYTLSGNGKRLRPLLTLIATNMFSEEIHKALNPAIGIEIFHNFTLLHDDIMDKAEIRRNKSTVHRKWNENVAILSGDAMMIKAYECFFTLPSSMLADILPVFNTAALQVCEGQQYDMNFESRMDVTTDEYLQMISLKTAVLIAGSLKIGALIGGSDKENADNLYDFGLNMGLIFQLQDDYLDVFGNEQTFGKQIGGDITSNKKTFLLLSALEKAQGETRNKLLYLLHVEPDTKAKINGITQIYTEMDIPKIVENKIEFYHQKAKEALAKVSIADEKKQILLNLSESLIHREK